MLGTAIPEGKEENKVFRRDLLTIPCWIPAQKCKGSASESYCFVGNPLSHAKLGAGLRLCFFPPYTPLLGLGKIGPLLGLRLQREPCV